MPRERAPAVFWIVLSATVLLYRVAHVNILWADEDYHLAAAVQLLHGKMLYRDLWYDKPPLNAIFDLLFLASPGLPLRLASSAVAVLSCVLAFKLADALWTRREGYLAATALAFFEIFYLPAAVIPLEPDTLLIAPHVAAVWLAVRNRPLAAGVASAAAVLLSPKGAFVMLAACVFLRSGAAIAAAAVAFAGVLAAAAVPLIAANAFQPFIDQVWRWGYLYATIPGSDAQAQRGLMAIFNWAGFHAALIVGTALLWFRERSARLLLWTLIAIAATLLGGRLAPRYFHFLLVPLVIQAARGIAVTQNRAATAALMIALLVPAARFGPRYLTLAWDNLRGAPHQWTDVAMDQESRRTAEWLTQQDSSTVFIWGYRPDVIAWSRLPVAGRLWDSQPVTGVPADRHLADARPIAPDWAARNRAELTRTNPTFIVDGLSAYNPALDIRKFPDLAEWFGGYCEATRIGFTTVYRRCTRPSQNPEQPR